MNEYLTLLRFLHIVFGAFWAGTVIMMHFFLFPAMAKLGPEGGKTMQMIMSTRKFPMVMTLSGVITIFSGLALMDHFSMHFTAEWFTRMHGFCLGLGGFFGITALLIGFTVNKPAADKMGALGAQIAASGLPPTPDQGTQLEALRARLMLGVKMVTWCVIVALVCMSIARYL